TFLSPHLALAQFAIRKQTRELRTRTRAARRTVVCLARTQNEVATINAFELRRAKQLDMIDLVTIRAGDAIALQRLANTHSEIGQRVEIVERQSLTVIVDEKKPVAAPGDVARHWSNVLNVDGYTREISVTRHVRDLDFAVFVEMRHDDANRSLNAMR